MGSVFVRVKNDTWLKIDNKAVNLSKALWVELRTEAAPVLLVGYSGKVVKFQFTSMQGPEAEKLFQKITSALGFK